MDLFFPSQMQENLKVRDVHMGTADCLRRAALGAGWVCMHMSVPRGGHVCVHTWLCLQMHVHVCS